MKYGAVIVAAGMSTRMKRFKPLMEIHGMSMVQRIITTFQQLAIKEIVVITGFNAQELEQQLKKYGVVCIRNENYATTQMFDSVKIGLDYIKDKCDAFFFTPADVPLFTADTVVQIRDMDNGKVRIPICNGRDGHPVYISADMVPEILQYNGDMGLKGALEELHTFEKKIPVYDLGIFMDADTVEDFEKLIKLHDEQLIRPQVKVRLLKKNPFFGPGTAKLLRQIEYSGSMAEASKLLGISYSKSRIMIQELEAELDRKVVERQQGGQHGGNARLTDYGKSILKSYEQYEKELEQFAQIKYKEIFHFFLDGECL